MPQYTYHATGDDGRLVTGDLSAEHASEAIAAIEARGLTVQSISLSSISQQPTLQIGPERGMPVKHSSLHRQFDAVLERRAVLTPALEALANEMPAGRPRGEIYQLAEVLRKSQSGSELSRSKVAIQWLPLLASGFSGDASSRRLSDVIAGASRESQNRSRRRRVLAYPIAVILIALLVFAFLCVLVVPTFGNMFEEMGIQIPASTAFVVFIADQFVRQPIRSLVIVALSAAAIYGLIRMWVHFAITTRFLGAFVAGNSASVSAMSSLTGQLSELLSIDVSLPDALWIAGQGCRHYHYKNVTEHLARWAHNARPLSESPDARYLPANVIYALQAGPNGAANIALLRELSTIYGDRAAQRVDWSSAAMAQFAIVVVGIAIGFVVIALFSPLIFLVTSLS